MPKTRYNIEPVACILYTAFPFSVTGLTSADIGLEFQYLVGILVMDDAVDSSYVRVRRCKYVRTTEHLGLSDTDVGYIVLFCVFFTFCILLD